MSTMVFNNVKGIIFDIDGVLEYHGKAYNGAVDTINSLSNNGFILRFLTNSTLKSRKSCAQRLKNYGFIVKVNEIITASYATAEYLKTLNPRSCWVMLAGEGLMEFNEFFQDTEDPEYVIMGDYRNNFNFENMNKALRLLKKKSKFIAMIDELVDRSMGDFELNVGSWAKMLEKASGVRATYIGKPNQYVFEITLKTMNLEKEEVIMVGDQVCTDIKGAKNFGIQSILLRTGEFHEDDLKAEIQPDIILDDLIELLRLIL